MKKIFGGINLTWKKLIIFAICSGIYTAVMALIPALKYTSFHDITVSFEVWILFGIIIISNSKSAKDSALKCFIYFLISQPIVYLIQVPFSSMGFEIFKYYSYWFIWTILTIPMGYIGYQIKKNKWWGMLILVPILLFLGIHYYDYLKVMIYNFPYHLITIIFCIFTLLIYPIYLFDNKKLKIVGLSISIIIIIVSTILALSYNYSYKTSILISGDSHNVIFDDSYKVYIKDKTLGNVYIEYEEDIEEYVINAEFNKAGKTDLILENKNGDKTIFDLNVKIGSYEINVK